MLAAPALKPLEAEYASAGIDFVFVYVREAHPGENLPAHKSMEQKAKHARIFRDELEITRPIVLDGLDGAGHLQYGALPNMTYLVGRGSTVLYRANWTEPIQIKSALEYLLNCRERRREGVRLAPFYSESFGLRVSDPKVSRGILEQSGQQALDDYEKLIKKFAGTRRVPEAFG